MSGVRIAWLFTSIAATAVTGIYSAIVQQQILGLVDAREPGRFNPPGWYSAKTRRLFSAYRQYYPEGKLIRLTYVLYGVGTASVISAAAAIGFFGLPH